MSLRLALRLSLLLLGLLACTDFSVAEEKSPALHYNRDIRPLLSNNCFECHGFDAKTREAELRLDQFEGATAELESGEGRAIVPGKPDESLLLARVTTHDDSERMPPADSGKRLTASQIETLRTWIIQGAKYERHWAFVAPEAVPPPAVRQADWPRKTIDRFVLARLERQGLQPSPEADRRTLIRRVAFDVTGLPPTREEINLYLQDQAPDAYEKMVDRYLASPRYGEHMARYWLDLARYADSNGYQYDTERTMWVWRDWVIDAYNRNMPFDQFTIEQLAGDLLPQATAQQQLATAFNRNHPITIEGGVIDEEYRTEYVLDRLTTTSEVWLGLTVGCARCHDHKFDPISQKEFFQLSAYFNQVPESGLNGFHPMQKIASPLAEEHRADTTQQIAALQQQAATLRQAIDDEALEREAEQIVATNTKWEMLDPTSVESSGGATPTKQEDRSIVIGGTNPQTDVYKIVARTEMTGIVAVRLECLTHPSLPEGGPGRFGNSNFVLSEFELVAVSTEQPDKTQPVKFTRAVADYSQLGYDIALAIDGTVAGNNGWAVDGPSRKEPATAMFFADAPFGFEGGTELVFRLRHETTFGMHGIGRPRLSISGDRAAGLRESVSPTDVVGIAAKRSADRTVAETERLRAFAVARRESSARAKEAKIAKLSNAANGEYPQTMIMRDMTPPRDTHVLLKGQYDRKGAVVAPGVPASLIPLAANAPSNRLGFAQWLTQPGHPLTSRVAVNRYWGRLFGTGLVKTAEDFGTQGDWPTHPELLDTLAVTFAKDWNVKAIQRLMLTSATYRQSAKTTPALWQHDPENRLLARGPRFRLDAEQVRDQALAAGGLLVDRLGGPSVYPYQPAGLWMELNNRPGLSKQYVAGTGDDLYRRSVYTFWKRSVPSPMLATFDAPTRELCTARRSRTNTPLQSLLLLHGPQFVEASRHLASRMMLEGGDAVESRIAYGFERVTCRVPTEQEIEIVTRVYRDRLKRFSADSGVATDMLKVGASPLEPSLPIAEWAAWTEIARLLLNLDETITRG